MTEVPETEMNYNMYKMNNKMTRRGRYSSQCCSNKIILTLPKFGERSKKFDVGVHTSLYDVWSGEWSSDFKVAIKQDELLEHHAGFNPEEKGKFGALEAHSSVVRSFPSNSQKLCTLFTLLPTVCKTKEDNVSPSNITLSECVMSTKSDGRVSQRWKTHVLDCESSEHNRIPQLAATNKNIHIINLLSTTNNNNGSSSLHTYNTEMRIWGKGALFSKKKTAVEGTSYVGFLDSIFAVGGSRSDNQETSGRVSRYPPQGGNGAPVQGMERGRIGPGVTEYDGKLSSAGYGEGEDRSWSGRV